MPDTSPRNGTAASRTASTPSAPPPESCAPPTSTPAITARTADPARIVPVTGLLTIPGAEPVRPHDEALWQLSDLYMVLEHHTPRAVRERRPRLRPRHRHRHRRRPAQRTAPPCPTPPRPGRQLPRPPPRPSPTSAQSLTTAAGTRDLADLRDPAIACETAQDTEQADAETEFTTALADTAYAYGERAERALHHLIRFAETHGFLHAS